MFGPCVAHNGVIYGDSNRNVRLALRRLTAARVSLELDSLFLNQQTIYINNSAGFLDQICSTYTQHTAHFPGMVEAMLLYHDLPHPKKALRVQAKQDLEIGFKGLNSSDRLWLHFVTYKMKKDEIAKPGKYPRMIGDLKVPASLQGFWATKLLKNVVSACPIFYRSGMIEFCAKPIPSKLVTIFSRLLDPPGEYYFVYFSDDACFSYRRQGRVYVYNLDIKSCDASHGPSIFDALIRVAPPSLKETITILVEQCTLPITIYDKQDRLRRVVLKPRRPRLYSGSTLTTVLNGLANTLIAKSLADNIEKLARPADIALQAAATGYIVTTELCSKPEDIQFLKHSPVLDEDGRLQAMLNIGVLLRASGTCRGDLPGRGDHELRAKRFQNALLKGMYPRVRFRLLDNLLSHTVEADDKSVARVAEKFKYKVVDEGEHFTVASPDCYRRYRLSAAEIEHLEQSFGHSTYQHHHVSTAADKILHKDYGLRCKSP